MEVQLFSNEAFLLLIVLFFVLLGVVLLLFVCIGVPLGIFGIRELRRRSSKVQSSAQVASPVTQWYPVECQPYILAEKEVQKPLLSPALEMSDEKELKNPVKSLSTKFAKEGPSFYKIGDSISDLFRDSSEGSIFIKNSNQVFENYPKNLEMIVPETGKTQRKVLITAEALCRRKITTIPDLSKGYSEWGDGGQGSTTDISNSDLDTSSTEPAVKNLLGSWGCHCRHCKKAFKYRNVSMAKWILTQAFINGTYEPPSP
ncbi:hypothetical protein Ciccas_009019, partial [Cichlidogyrus casuarinus]